MVLLQSAGTKALLKTMELEQDAKHALYMFQLHVVCHTLKDRMMDAVYRLIPARRKLSFHLDVAMQKGDPADFEAWRPLIAKLDSFDLLYGKILADLQAMEAAGDTMLWRRPPPATAQQPPATAPGQAAAASLPQQGDNTCSMPSGASSAILMRALEDSGGQAVSNWSPIKGEIEVNAADHPELFTIDGSGDIVDQPMSELAAFLMDAKPAELPPGKTVGQLFQAGCPSSLACSGYLTAPQPSFKPFDIQGTYPANADPNLIVWDPDENAANWIHPELHLSPSVLVEFAAIYSSTDVLFETDCDEHGVLLDHRHKVPTEQHALTKLKEDSLPPFAVAGAIDIMVQALLRDLAWEEHRKAGTEDKTQPGANCLIWSRRLVYRRQISQDSLVGCVQVCRQRALQNWDRITSLLRTLNPKMIGSSTACEETGLEQPGMHRADSGPAGGDGRVTLNMSRPDSSAPPQEGDCYVKLPAGQNLEHYARCVGALFPPETAARISQVASEHVRRAQDQKAKPSDPASRPLEDGSTHVDSNPKAPSTGESELVKKLRDAQRQLEKRFGSSSSKESRGRYDSALLEREKQDERNRAAWAKVGKDPPPPKAPKPNVKVDRIESPPPDAPKDLTPIKQEDGVRRPLPTYASSKDAPANPTADKPASSSTKATTKSAATSASSAGRPQAPGSEAPSGTPSEPAAKSASETTHADQPASDASKPTTENGVSIVSASDEKCGPGHPAASLDPDDAEDADLQRQQASNTALQAEVKSLEGQVAKLAASQVEDRSDDDAESGQDDGDYEDEDEDGDEHEDDDDGDGSEDNSADDGDDEDYEIYDAVDAANEEAEAAREARQMFAEAKEEARRAAEELAAKKARRFAEARTKRLEREMKEKQALDNADKLLL